MSAAEWQQPQGHKLAKEGELAELVKDTNSRHVIDSISQVADDLYDMHHPGELENHQERARYHQSVASEGETFGRWFYYDWIDTVIRLPDEPDHYNLRTFRNRNLVTPDEQATLRRKKIAVVGLSVGSAITHQLNRAGIGDEYMLFDFDKVSVPNLNRLEADVSDIGKLKTTVAGQRISLLDPYVKQQHFPEGYTDKVDDILREQKPDIIFEEVDNLQVKAKLRRIAAELKTPLIMAGDVDDRSTIDVERHDLEDVQPFNGKISDDQYEKLLSGDFTESEVTNMLIKILGMRNISPRLLDSKVKIGTELTGIPQLGTTATGGGIYATIAAREIFLGRSSKSLTKVHKPRELLEVDPATSKIDTAKIFVNFVRHQLRQKK